MPDLDCRYMIMALTITSLGVIASIFLFDGAHLDCTPYILVLSIHICIDVLMLLNYGYWFVILDSATKTETEPGSSQSLMSRMRAFGVGWSAPALRLDLSSMGRRVPIFGFMLMFSIVSSIGIVIHLSMIDHTGMDCMKYITYVIGFHAVELVMIVNYRFWLMSVNDDDDDNRSVPAALSPEKEIENTPAVIVCTRV